LISVRFYDLEFLVSGFMHSGEDMFVMLSQSVHTGQAKKFA
jgi:hypothetical protein